MTGKKAKQVVVEVSGGVATVTKCPKGVMVVILDQDNKTDGFAGSVEDVFGASKAEADQKKATSHSLATNMHVRNQG
ncbi:MAG: hypothetical protein KKD44_28520 [Proteobacteria bacterium]|nr:hypothetical protein [Pseudomonadota bacterium]